MMEPKKISFGFSKTIKKPNLLSNKTKEDTKKNIDLIKCVEGQSIQLLSNQDHNAADTALVIPMKQSNRTSTALASLKLRQEILNGVNEINDNRSLNDKIKDGTLQKTEEFVQNETIEQKVARELLKEARGENVEENVIPNLTVPIKADELPLDGAVESNIDDYENVPVSQFGLAMLRGMGWKDNEMKSSKSMDEPALRPKGMGLGADKVLLQKKILIPPEANEKLEIKKNAYVRILGGKYKDLYGQIEGLDDHAGRVFLKLALGGTHESLNEFMVQPVSKREYSEYGKVINTAKYEEYKKMENAQGQIIIKKKNIKLENDSLNGEERKQSDRTVYARRSSVEDSDEEYKKSERQKTKEMLDYRKCTVKKEHKERSNKQYVHNSSKYDNDKRDKSRRKSPDKYREASRHDYSRSKHRDNSSDYSSSPKSHKSKKKSKSKDKRHKYRQDSSDDDKRHKKKTKKSKRPRSRSRERR